MFRFSNLKDTPGMGNALRLAAAATAGACLACTWGCGLLGGAVGAEIKVEGGQYSLDEQVLGAFDEVGEEVYVLAGVRALDPVTGLPEPATPMTDSESRALAARRRMEFNRDDILLFKKRQFVGEGRDGLLAVFPDAVEPLRTTDPRLFALVADLVAEENQDRTAVMQRIVETTPDLAGDEGLAQVGRILAARNRQDAAPGVKVQSPDGTWRAKGAESP